MKRKFMKGPLVRSMPELIAGIFEDHWFYFNDKVQNKAWLQNMSLRTLALYVEHHRVCYAIRIEQ